MRVALVGAQGFVGASIGRAFASCPDISVVPVARKNYDAARKDGHYDILINSAMPSRRFWARQNPNEDFLETVQKTSRLVNDWAWGKFIQISSISARSQLDTIYGRHKAAAEKICSFDESLVLRLGPMYGAILDKGVLIDLLNDATVFVARESRYCF
ncbi:MAG: NAD(P)-dependent oxidoreductase, partial [Pseudomonadota bacterium]|nr:NAD(P)-dependent oxidoreductase [Pseudomonadota bacterium]